MRDYSGTWFDPAVITAFERIPNVADDLTHISKTDLLRHLKQFAAAGDRMLCEDEVVHFAQIISRIIDFRSRFTATHSHGVAATSRLLGKLHGLSETDYKLLYISGCLHDIGKLGIPRGLIEKPGKLSTTEFHTVKQHALFTSEILGAIPGMDFVAKWSGSHHERLNGSGYPRGIGAKHLDTGSRILAVADVFTALTEDRPYRQGMPNAETTHILQDMVAVGNIDPEATSVLLDNFDLANTIRLSAQQEALHDFVRFNDAC